MMVFRKNSIVKTFGFGYYDIIELTITKEGL